MVGMLVTSAVKDTVERLTAHEGIEGGIDAGKGTVEVRSQGVVVFQGIEKGHTGVWIVRYTNGPNVKWS